MDNDIVFNGWIRLNINPSPIILTMIVHDDGIGYSGRGAFYPASFMIDDCKTINYKIILIIA